MEFIKSETFWGLVIGCTLLAIATGYQGAW